MILLSHILNYTRVYPPWKLRMYSRTCRPYTIHDELGQDEAEFSSPDGRDKSGQETPENIVITGVMEFGTVLIIEVYCCQAHIM